LELYPNLKNMEPEELKTVDITVMLTMSTKVPIDQNMDDLKQEVRDQLARSIQHTDFDIEEILIED